MSNNSSFSGIHAHSGIEKLSPYIPGKPIELVQREYGLTHVNKLAANENPYGPSDWVMSKASQLFNDKDFLSRYPDGSGYELKQKLSRRLKLQCSEQITLGNGSNDVLDMIARCFASIGDEVIYSQYAFAVYPLATMAVGATGVEVPAKEYGHDLQAMLGAINDKTKIIFIANPNNPTGTVLAAEELKQFIEAVPKSIAVVIDEAYYEYCSHSASPYVNTYQSAFEYLPKHPNLIITRTFSKAYGLASMRVGYAVSHPQIADYLNRVRQPFNNNSFALALASEALNHDDWVDWIAYRNWVEMKHLESFLDAHNFHYIPSGGNFICVDFKQNAHKVEQELLNKGIILRSVANYNMESFIRISIGKELENQRLMDAIASL